MLPAPLWLALVRAMLVVDDGTRITPLSLHGEGTEEALRRKKGSKPRLAALGSPSQRKGLAWTLPPSYGRRCPKGAEVGWGSGMKESEEMHLKSTINESTLSIADAVPSSLRETGRGIHFSFTNFHLSMI